MPFGHDICVMFTMQLRCKVLYMLSYIFM